MIVDWLLLSIQSENILLLVWIITSGEGLQKLGLKSILIINTLLADTGPSVETIRKPDLFICIICVIVTKRLNSRSARFSVFISLSSLCKLRPICFQNNDDSNGKGWGLRNSFPNMAKSWRLYNIVTKYLFYFKRRVHEFIARLHTKFASCKLIK